MFLAQRELTVTESIALEKDHVVPPVPTWRPWPAHALRYDGPGGAMLEMVWEGYEDFGLWSKPGAEFLCLEPWAGHASPLGWDGEFAGKPGVILLEPGRARRFHWTVTLRPAA